MSNPNKATMDIKRKQLADLYYKSNSVKFGRFKISAHEQNPNLPLSPLYLHYPKSDEAGCELLPQMFELIGYLFHKMILDQNIVFSKIAGIPAGADPFAETTAHHFSNIPDVLLKFKKETDDVGSRIFTGPIPSQRIKSQKVLVLDDHTSGGYNKSLFVKMLEENNAVVTDVLTIVDREQGATEFLRSIGITLHSIFTISELLDYYVETKQISLQQHDEVRAYITADRIVVRKI